MLEFPDRFFWGATLCAHQTEGGNFNSDWWRWEQRPSRIADSATSQHASDHWNRLEADAELIHKLGQSAHLFNVEWSRIEPEDGVVDRGALRKYVNYAKALNQRAIEPVCVVNHATLPVWFADQGGWESEKAVPHFLRYLSAVLERLGPLCRWWIPIFEPVEYVRMAYIEGKWPPGAAAPWRARRVLERLAQAHARSYTMIHEHVPQPMVGITVRGRRFMPLDDDNSWDLRTVRREEYISNRLLLELLRSGKWPLMGTADVAPLGAYDFIGLSYYGVERLRFRALSPRRLFAQTVDATGKSVASAEPMMHAEGLYDLLAAMQSEGKPVVITGSGISNVEDSARCRFILEHLDAIHRAISDGADVRGYFYRSLFDQFEWTEGYRKRFGLVHVNFETFARTPNRSAYLLKDICESNSLRRGTLSRFCPDWRPSRQEVA